MAPCPLCNIDTEGEERYQLVTVIHKLESKAESKQSSSKILLCIPCSEMAATYLDCGTRTQCEKHEYIENVKFWEWVKEIMENADADEEPHAARILEQATSALKRLTTSAK